MERKRMKGFTLIELLVVIAIIGILAILIFLALSRAQMSARDAQRKAFARDAATAEAIYYDAHKTYTTDMIKLTGLDSSKVPVPWLPGNQGETTWKIYVGKAGNDCSTSQTEGQKTFCVSTRLETDHSVGFRCTEAGCSDTP
jgi:prepilin-type N-terminal cleavage/methylation domain-containing protein